MTSLWILLLLAGGQEADRETLLEQDIAAALLKLGSIRYTESYVAQNEIVEIGRVAVPAVVAALRKDDLEPAVKRSLCEILGAIRAADKDAVRALKEGLKDNREYGTSIAAAAARALASIGDPGAIGAIRDTLESKAVETDKILKVECIRALGILRATEASEILRKALEDKQTAAVSEGDDTAPLVASAAADALGRIRAKDAVDDLGKRVPETIPDPSTGQPLGVHASRALQLILADEIKGDPRSGLLAGLPDEVNKTWEAWKTWAGDRKAVGDAGETRARISKIVEAMGAYKKAQGGYPAVLGYLKTKPDSAEKYPEGGYYDGELKDAWGRHFDYKTPGTGSEFDVVSLGRDGTAGGKGPDADLWNHDAWIAVRRDGIRKKLEEVAEVIERFKKDQGKYPEKLQDLVTKPGYLPKPPVDVYNRPLIYRVPGAEDAPFDLISHGADGAEGGAGADEDVGNHGGK